MTDSDLPGGSVDCFGRVWANSVFAVGSSPVRMTVRFILHVTYWVLAIIFGGLLVGEGVMDSTRTNTASVAVGLGVGGVLAIVLDIIGITCGLCRLSNEKNHSAEVSMTMTKEIAHYLGWASFILYVAVFSSFLTDASIQAPHSDRFVWAILAMTFQGLAIITYLWNATAVPLYIMSSQSGSDERLL